MSNAPPVIADARQPPPPVERRLLWSRITRVPPETDPRAFVLLLADGTYLIGRRRTLKRVVGQGGPLFVRGSSVAHVPLIETHFADAAGHPLDGVVWWAPLEPPA